MAGRMVVFVGEMYDPTLSVGGGPMPGGPPLGIWGGRPPPYVDIGFPGPQPGGWPHPSHPIYYPQPPRPWGPINYPDQGLPGNQPYPDIGFPGPQPHPEHPIAPGGPGTPPLTIWGGGGVGNYPDAGFPGPQPGKPPQIWGGPYFPPVIWPPPGPMPGPEHPIAPGGEGERQKLVDWRYAWSPTTGWVVVGIPTGPTPTPSAEEPAKG